MKLLGIDPGWKNLGYALLDVAEDGKVTLEDHGVYNPSKVGVLKAVRELRCILPDIELDGFTMERYVAYAGVTNADSEYILMLIGALMARLSMETQHGVRVDPALIGLMRAIDWKKETCKMLFKEQGFRNPSPKFDKVFSVAAAETICGQKLKSDHVADAVCLAYYPITLQKLTENKK